MSHAGADPRTRLLHPIEFFCNIRNHTLRRIGRGGCSEVGDIIEKGAVGFVADGTHERSDAGRGGADQGLVAEHQEVLKITTPAGDDDDVDLGIGVKLFQCRGDFADSAIALHCGIRDTERDGGPAQLSVAQDVFFGIAVSPGDQADAVGEKGEGTFAGRVEKSLGAQGLAQSLEAFEEVAEAHVAHLEDLHCQAAALDPVVGFDEGNHTVTLLEVGGNLRLDRRPDGERHGRVGVEVFEFAVDVAARHSPLGDLALNPDAAEPVDPAFDFGGEQAHRPRCIHC